MAHANRFRPRVRGYRRKTTWEFGPNAQDVTVSSSAQKLFTTGIQLASVTQATIVRIRGFINIWMTAGTASGDGFMGAFGIGIATADALAAGVAAVPSPLEDEFWDGWMWHSYWDTRVLTATFADGVNAGSVYQRIEIDTKAMRILRDDEVLFGTNDQVESGTATAEYNAESRVLLKLP